mgnify:CR=1 FL=1
MNAKPLFSIIIPTRNRAPLLLKAIDSVRSQVFKNWELIIVDDGSTDDTREVVEGIQENRIRYFYQEHKERSGARNRGIKVARGDYICFLDDDDYLLPQYLQDFAVTIYQPDYSPSILRTGFYRAVNDTLTPAINYSAEKHENPVQFILFNMCGVGSLCIPTSWIAALGFPQHIYYWEDTYLFLQLLMQHPFIQLEEHRYVYQLNEGESAVHFYTSPQLLNLVDNNISAMIDFYKNFGEELHSFVPSWSRRYILAEKYLDHAIASIPFTAPKISFFFLRKSFQYPCFHYSILRKYLIWIVQFTAYYLLGKTLSRSRSSAESTE